MAYPILDGSRHGTWPTQKLARRAGTRLTVLAKPAMSTKAPTAQNDCGIDLPSNWTRTCFNGADEQTFERTDDEFGLVRVTREIPLESAAACNEARHTNDEGNLVVLVNDEPLPSTPDELETDGTIAGALEAAQSAMEARR